MRLFWGYKNLCECIKLKGMEKLKVFLWNGKIKRKLLENDPGKPFAHMTDFKKIFLDIHIDNLWFCYYGAILS